MKDIQIKDALLHVLKNMSDTPFTVAQLTQKYLNHHKTQHSSKQAARQYVYRKMKCLIENDQLIKLPEVNGWPRYQLTSEFLDVSVVRLANVKITDNVKIPRQSTVAAHRHVSSLKEKLSRYRSEMLCAIGESEEYSALCNEHPDLRESAQDLYNQARERSATLLGKMKALENMLSQYAG